MNYTKSLLAKAVFSCALLAAMPAHAFLNELVGAGVAVGGKLLGAGVDKLKDSMKDQEAEAKQKKDAQGQQLKEFNESVARIEERSDLSPLQKEREVRQMRKQFDFVNLIAALDEQAQAHRRAQRDRLFTAEGMLDTVGNAAVGAASTRIVLAKADAMVAAGVPQAQTRSVLGQIDASAVGAAREKTQQVLTLIPVAAAIVGSAEQPAARAANNVAASLPSEEAPAKAEASSEATAAPVLDSAPPVVLTAFSPDLERKLSLIFVGAPKTQETLRTRLVALGHHVVEDASLADVVYRIEGEYVVPEGKQYSGTRQGFGEILDAEALDWQPDRKMTGTIGAGLSKFMLALGKAQGAQIPKELEGGSVGQLKQGVLLVISREPKNGKTSRASFSRDAVSTDVQAVPLVLATYAELLDQLGLNP